MDENYLLIVAFISLLGLRWSRPATLGAAWHMEMSNQGPMCMGVAFSPSDQLLVIFSSDEPN